MTRIAVIGLGPIGLNVARIVLQDNSLSLAGLIDIDPAKAGKKLNQIGADIEGGPAICSDLSEETLGGAGVAIVTTTSRFDQIAPMLRELIGHRVHIVSSCEEMAWPTFRHPQLAKQVNDEAKRAGVALLGTGVNPGFVMDYLPVILSSMMTAVTCVKVIRRVDASTRRKPLQAKVGATMSVERFNQLASEGKIGHMGIGESVALLAAGLGRHVEPGEVTIMLNPVLADKSIPSAVGIIQPGQVRGMRNTAQWNGQGLRIELDLEMAVGTTDLHDSVELDGSTPLKLRIEGGTPGDTATVASLVNAARILPHCAPGLKTMVDIPAAGAKGQMTAS